LVFPFILASFSVTGAAASTACADKRQPASRLDSYFCDPQNPWQRGTNGTNGFLRQHVPKGPDLSGYSEAQLNAMARQLNERPRKTLNFETPAERFHQTVARSVETTTLICR
jgi:IS30 family transposase